MKPLYIAALLAVSSLAANAQSLHKEITVEHDIVPEIREATRLSFTPQLTLAPVKTAGLSYSERMVTTRVPGIISVLDPAPYADTIYTSPYRGYAAAGFMPTFNLGVSAGYRIADTDRTRLNAWIQYDGTSYKKEDLKFNSNTVTGALALHQAVGKNSYLDGGLDYTYSRYSTPVCTSDAASAGTPTTLSDQSVNRLKLSLLWSSSSDEIKYTIGAGYGLFGYGIANFVRPQSSTADIPAPTTEHQAGVSAKVSSAISDRSSVGIDFGFSFVEDNNRNIGYASIGPDYTLESGINVQETYFGLIGRPGSHNHGLITAVPRYRTAANGLTLDLGIKLNASFNNGDKFHIAPDVTVGANPSPYFSFMIKATGGVVQNTLASIYDVTPYAPSQVSYNNSSIPLDANADITIGPWRGAYIEVFGGYAIANNWLMPACDNFTAFIPSDIKGWHAGAAIGYAYRSLAELRVSAETSPRRYDRGYYLWRDRAKEVIKASLRITPLPQLDITAAYELRTDRKILYRRTFIPDGSLSSTVILNTEAPLGDVSNLSVGAVYRLTSRFSVFLEGENLLNKEYTRIGGVPSQGTTGLVGVTYKF